MSSAQFAGVRRVHAASPAYGAYRRRGSSRQSVLMPRASCQIGRDGRAVSREDLQLLLSATAMQFAHKLLLCTHVDLGIYGEPRCRLRSGALLVVLAAVDGAVHLSSVFLSARNSQFRSDGLGQATNTLPRPAALPKARVVCFSGCLTFLVHVLEPACRVKHHRTMSACATCTGATDWRCSKNQPTCSPS